MIKWYQNVKVRTLYLNCVLRKVQKPKFRKICKHATREIYLINFKWLKKLRLLYCAYIYLGMFE